METERIHVPLSQEFVITGGCPMCNEGTLLVQFEGWEEDDNNPDLWNGIDLTRVECSNEPDLESVEWDEFQNWHSYMPYVNWLPRITMLEELLNKKYIFDDKLSEKTEPIKLILSKPKEAELKQ